MKRFRSAALAAGIALIAVMAVFLYYSQGGQKNGAVTNAPIDQPDDLASPPTTATTTTTTTTTTTNPAACKGSAACISGVVTRIVDGDTLDVNSTRVRLALIDTPEAGDDGYFEATEKLGSLCPAGSMAVVDEDDRQKEGSFGRLIGKVYCGGREGGEGEGADRSANEMMLDSGNAVIYSRHCGDSEFAGEEWAQRHGC